MEAKPTSFVVGALHAFIRRYFAARTLTYCQFATLARRQLMLVLNLFPRMYRVLRLHAIKGLFRRVLRGLTTCTEEQFLYVNATINRSMNALNFNAFVFRAERLPACLIHAVRCVLAVWCMLK